MRKPDLAAATQTARLFDLVTEFFGGGRYWIKGDFNDSDGNRCLVDALRRMRSVHRLHGDAARYYLQKAMRYQGRCVWPLAEFNDSCCENFVLLQQLIDDARMLAISDIQRQQRALLAVAESPAALKRAA